MRSLIIAFLALFAISNSAFAANEVAISEKELILKELGIDNLPDPVGLQDKIDQIDSILEEPINQPELSAEYLPLIEEAEESVVGYDVSLSDDQLWKNLNILEENNRLLEDKINQLTERVNLLEGKLLDKKLEKKLSKRDYKGNLYDRIHEHFAPIKERLGIKVFTITITSIILAFIALLIYLIVPRRKEVCNISYPRDNAIMKEDNIDDSSEGMETAESKLNLARVYVEMGEKEKAKSMLQGILLHGDDAKQEEARALLDKIKSSEG